jgi:four helix bundle protein
MSHSSFRDLIAWRRARRLVPAVYKLTDGFPKHEQYVLTAQIRRAAHSVPLNLAEGSGRLSNGEWQQFLGQSRASLMELESALIQAYDLEYATPDQLEPLFQKLREVAKLINGLLRASIGKRPKKFSEPRVNG